MPDCAKNLELASFEPRRYLRRLQVQPGPDAKQQMNDESKLGPAALNDAENIPAAAFDTE